MMGWGILRIVFTVEMVLHDGVSSAFFDARNGQQIASERDEERRCKN
jgi:hypothetical protein